MSTLPRAVILRTAVIATAVSAAAVLGAPGNASADVRPGTYTSITKLNSGAVILQRVGRVHDGQLVLIGRYPIHRTAKGGYVDLFPGHRVVMNSDGHGGYSGPAYWGGAVIGKFVLRPRR